MATISRKRKLQLEALESDVLHGRVLTPDGLRIICRGLGNDPEKIGILMLEILAKFERERLFGANTRLKEAIEALEGSTDAAKRSKS